MSNDDEYIESLLKVWSERLVVWTEHGWVKASELRRESKRFV